MGGMGRPIQPKKIINTRNKMVNPKQGEFKQNSGADKLVTCSECSFQFSIKVNPFFQVKCPRCKAVQK